MDETTQTRKPTAKSMRSMRTTCALARCVGSRCGLDAAHLRRRGDPSQAHSAPDAIRRLGARHGECFPWLIMGEPRMVGCYQTVNRAYEDVSMLLRREPLDLLQRATTTASARARSLATSLRVELAGLEVSVDVRLYVRGIRDGEKIAGVLPALRIELTWEAIHNRALFPSMLAEILVWPPSARETQIEIHGVYWTPMGPIGTALDAAVGHRIAEAAVYRFLSDVVAQLHRELPPLDSPRGKAESRPSAMAFVTASWSRGLSVTMQAPASANVFSGLPAQPVATTRPRP